MKTFLFYHKQAEKATSFSAENSISFMEVKAMRQVILYGISGASRAYTVLSYFCIYEESISIGAIQGEARQITGMDFGVTIGRA